MKLSVRIFVVTTVLVILLVNGWMIYKFEYVGQERPVFVPHDFGGELDLPVLVKLIKLNSSCVSQNRPKAARRKER